MPKVVEFRTEPLPKSNIGKVLRRALRHAAATPNAASPAVASA
jgi:long-chain acyl-CoA synthetase